MASKDFSQSEQLHSDVLRETPNPEGTALKYRHPSVYEAVAGILGIFKTQPHVVHTHTLQVDYPQLDSYLKNPSSLLLEIQFLHL